MKFISLATVAVLAIALSSTGCSSTSVEQKIWVLESFAGESMPIDSLPAVESQFSLKDGTVTGNGGVNSFNGTYELSGENISFGPLASTKMAGPPYAMEQETRFLQALGSAAHVEVSDEKMTLSDGDDDVLMLLVPGAEG